MPYAGDLSNFALFQLKLIGTWSNQPFPQGKHGEGGEKNPLSYNIMPLPQASATDGYILKNFKYFETIRFNGSNDPNDKQYYDKDAIATVAKAPNRGGTVTQNARALFYDQRVSFAEGPTDIPRDSAIAGQVVHVENGAWLDLKRAEQQNGAFPTGADLPEPPGQQQPSDLDIAKQIAVPHGNSVLALGSFDTVYNDSADAPNPVLPGKPVIPDAPFPNPVPTGLDVTLYVAKSVTSACYNPHEDLTQHPNLPLQQAVDLLAPDHYMHWHVTTLELAHGQGSVTNIPFEHRVARVTAYWADYWLLSTDKANDKELEDLDFDYLAYTQTMLMEMNIKGEKYLLPHVTCNTVTKK